MREKLSTLYGKDGTKKVLSSLISIVIGLVIGAIVVCASFLPVFLPPDEAAPAH